MIGQETFREGHANLHKNITEWFGNKSKAIQTSIKVSYSSFYIIQVKFSQEVSLM